MPDPTSTATSTTTTIAPGHTTTAAPAATTTAAPAGTTTAAPVATTTVAPAGTTTAAPAGTTTAAPAGTTTAAPGGTTTSGPSSTTTAAGGGGTPTISSVEVDLDPDDGAQHHDHSIEVASDVKLTLKWESTGATGMHIDGLGDYDASGSQEIPTQNASYSLIAKGDGGSESAPWPLEVHVHDPKDVVSPHVDLGSGVAAVVSFEAHDQNDQTVTSAKIGDSLKLVVVVSEATESAKIADQDADLSDTGDGHKTGNVSVTIDDATKNTFEAQAIKGGSAADTKSLQLDVLSGTTTAAPGATTTAAPGGTTTVAPGGTTTAAPGGTTTAPPGTTTTAPPAGTTTAPGATTTAPHATTTALGTTTTKAPGTTTTKAPGTTTTAAGRSITAFKATFTGKDGDKELSSRPGSFKDPSNEQEKKHTLQHFPAGGTQLTFEWTVTGVENAVVDMRIDQLSALPKGETRSSSDFFTDLTRKGNGTVSYDWTLPPGRVTLWIDLVLLDPKDPSKPLDTRCIIAFTDSGLPAIDKLTLEGGAGGQLFCNWSVVRAPASNVWLAMTDGSGKAIGSPIQLRDVKANAATSGRTLVTGVDTTKFPGQTLTGTAAIFMVADGSGSKNAPPFNIASEGLVIGQPTVATFGAKGPVATTTHAPGGTTTSAPGGTTTHAPGGTTTRNPTKNGYKIKLSLGNKTTLKPLIVADGKLKTSTVNFTYQLEHLLEDPAAGPPDDPPPDISSIEIKVLDPSGGTIKTDTFTSGDMLRLGVRTWEWDGYSDANVLDTQMLRRTGLKVQVTVKAPGISDAVDTLTLDNSKDGLKFTDVQIDTGANTIAVKVRFVAERKPLPLTGVQVLPSQVDDVVAAIQAGIPNFWGRTITIDSTNFAVSSSTSISADDSISVIVIPEVPPGRSCNLGMFLPSITGDAVLYMVEPISTAIRDQYTGAHEIGHAIVAIRQGKDVSATHKGTSTIAGDDTAAQEEMPASGEIDLMKYWKHERHDADYKARARLVETDMKDLLEFTVVVFST